MHRWLQVLCLVPIAGCSVAGEGRPPVEAGTSFLGYDITDGLRCAPASGLLGCLREHEPLHALAAGIQPERQGTSLCLPILAEATCFVDRDGLGYAFLGPARDQLVVVETEATGGYTVILVDAANAVQRRVDNRPLHSSSAGLFATVSYDTDAGYLPNRVAVWNAGHARPIYEFDDFAPGQGPIGIRWRGPLTLEVRYSRQPFSPAPAAADHFHVWRDGKGVWNNDYGR